MKKTYLHETDLSALRDTVVFLDIDGTLLAEKPDPELDEATSTVASTLAQNNTVYLVTNGRSRSNERNEQLASQLGARFHRTGYKKPLKRTVQELIDRHPDRPYVVIGDKFLTDGLLAVRLRIPFIEVRAIRAHTDSLLRKALYAIDDTAKFFFGWLARPPYPNGPITILTRPPRQIRTIPHDIARVIKRTIKKLLFWLHPSPNYMPTGGPEAVIRSLITGLDELGQEYRPNPWWFKVTDTVGVIADPKALRWAIQQKKRGFIKTIIAGPNILNAPPDEDHLIQDPAIDRIVVPSPWNKDWWASFDQYLAAKTVAWAAGIADQGEPKPRDKRTECLVYAKDIPERSFKAIMEVLWRRGVNITVLKYGYFRQQRYFQLLRKSRFMVYLSHTESQGIALHEAWMADVPTLIWNPGFFTIGDRHWEDARMSAPYFNETCGVLFKNEDDFEQAFNEFTARYDQLRPREYSLINFSDKRSAANYLEIIRDISQNNEH